jgi:hypothetical protein
MNGMATARPAYTLGSWVAIQQKSSSRGSPQCSTTKFRSVKSVATWSTSATSKASRSSGRIVGPLWTWMFLMPELAADLEVAVGHRVGELPAAGLAVPVGGVELHALEAEALGVGAQRVQAVLAVARVPVVVVGELVRVGLREREGLLGLPKPRW